jgi:hypothetical protein
VQHTRSTGTSFNYISSYLYRFPANLEKSPGWPWWPGQVAYQNGNALEWTHQRYREMRGW